MADMSDHEPELIQQLKSFLMVIVGYCDAVLGDLPAEHPHRPDVEGIDRVARAAMRLVPDLTKRMNSAGES